MTLNHQLYSLFPRPLPPQGDKVITGHSSQYCAVTGSVHAYQGEWSDGIGVYSVRWGVTAGCVTPLIKCTVNADTLGAWGNLRAALLVHTFSLPRMVGSEGKSKREGMEKGRKEGREKKREGGIVSFVAFSMLPERAFLLEDSFEEALFPRLFLS